MNALLIRLNLGALERLFAPFRRSPRPQQPATMDAATYAAMVAEAERIAAPYVRTIAAQRALARPQPADEPGGEFPEVDALLERAGIMV